MMSRFYKIHLMPNVPKQRYDIFMINPSMNTFDSFMIEICSRLPELFYQPFKLLYRGISFLFALIMCEHYFNNKFLLLLQIQLVIQFPFLIG